MLTEIQYIGKGVLSAVATYKIAINLRYYFLTVALGGSDAA